MTITRAFQPLAIGPVEVKNRIVSAAHDTGFAPGAISDAFIAYHAARARGGCGLAILEAASVHPSSGLHLHLFDDAIVDGYRRLVAAVRPHGMRVFQQLWHGGNLYPAVDGGPPWAVSDVAGYWGMVGKPMTRAEIAELVAAHAEAARRAQRGGLDGAEVHGCHGYLFHQFLSPHYNTRGDDYGGSLENRSRILFEALRAIRTATGPGFAVGVRLGVSDAPGGVGVEDNRRVLAGLQAEGLIDYVSFSVGDYYRMDTMVGSMQHPAGYELAATAVLRAAASVPRLVTGRFRTVEEADQVLRDGEADLVSMVRAQIADPELVLKTRQGQADEVRPCIGCNQGCIGGLFRTGRVGCLVNPAVGREAEFADPVPADPPRRVLVIGGGPAGMEAARVAALRGHRVTLAEAGRALGGTAAIARTAPHLAGIGDILLWLEQQIYRLGVDVRLNTYLEADEARNAGYDAIVVATGSLPRKDGFQIANPGLCLPGCELPHVLSSHELLSAGRKPSGAAALVLDTVGHYEALAVAEYLLRHGLAVCYLTHAPGMTPYVASTWRDVPALERFHALGDFQLLTRHQLVAIEAGACTVRPIQAGPERQQRVAADTVVLVTQNMPLRGVYDELRGGAVPVHLIGDAASPRDIQAAITDGHRVGRAIA